MLHTLLKLPLRSAKLFSTMGFPFKNFASAQVTNIKSPKEWADLVSKSGSTPIVLDFYAKWCGPSRTLDPVVEKNVKESGGKVTLAKANVDECGDLIHEFGVTAIPHLALVHKGKVVTQSVGITNDEIIIRFFRTAKKLTEAK